MQGLTGFYCKEIDGHLWAYVNWFSQCFSENNIGDKQKCHLPAVVQCKTHEGWLVFLSLHKPDKGKKLFQADNM